MLLCWVNLFCDFANPFIFVCIYTNLCSFFSPPLISLVMGKLKSACPSIGRSLPLNRAVIVSQVRHLTNGIEEDMLLTESCFLTLDGRNGMFFQALYPGYVQAEDGSVTLVMGTSGAYEDPVYDILSVSGGVTTPVLAFPDETLTIGDVSFTLLDPVSYPGLRIKHMHTEILGMLYATFVLIVAALYLCFFMVPVAVKVTESGYAVLSPKTQTGLMIELEALLKEEA